MPTPKLLIPSGGLTGFGVAPDLLMLDFSSPEEAPEEFRAVPYFEMPREIKPGLSGSLLFLLQVVARWVYPEISFACPEMLKADLQLSCNICLYAEYDLET